MKNIYTIFTLFLLFLAPINVSAQNINTNPFWEGEIILNDGTSQQGFIQVPNNPAQGKVLIKSTKNGKNKKVKKKDIQTIKLTSQSGTVYQFEPVKVVLTLKGNSSLGKSLLLISKENDYAKFYVSYGVYRVNKDGELYMLYRYMQGRDFPSLEYYIKKRDFEKARLFHETNLSRGFKKSANAYLKEDPALLKKINNNELNFKDIDEIIEMYLETTKNL